MEKKIQNDDEDYFMKPNNPRELLLPEHLMPFLMQYLKDMKNESIEILIHEDCDAFLKVLEISPDDLSTLTDEDLVKFKEIFNSKRMSQFHQGTGKMMDTLYDYLIDILAKRVPVEGVNVKVEQIIHKIKLVSVPEDIILADKIEKVKVTGDDGVEVEQEVEKKKNTSVEGLIIISVPQYEEEQEITIEITQGTSEAIEGENASEKPKPKTKVVLVMVDVDQQDKAMSVKPRSIDGFDNKSFYLINKYAQKAFREEFLDYISRLYPTFFEETDDWEQINKNVSE
jgi:hypothetical protein